MIQPVGIATLLQTQELKMFKTEIDQESKITLLPVMCVLPD